MTAHGSPDESRAARLVLKDYVTGRLLFCHKPPAEDTAEALAKSISPPLSLIPAPLFHVPRRVLTTARTPTMRQSTHEAAFERQAHVAAVSGGRAGQEGFTRITRPYSPVPLVKPPPKRTAAPKKTLNLSRFAASAPTPAPPTASAKQERKLG